MKVARAFVVGLVVVLSVGSAQALEASEESCTAAVKDLDLPSSPYLLDDGFFRDTHTFAGTVECYESDGHLVIKSAGETVAEDGFYGLVSLEARAAAKLIEREKIEQLKTERDKEVQKAEQAYKDARLVVESDAKMQLEQIRNRDIPASVSAAMALEIEVKERKDALKAEKIATAKAERDSEEAERRRKGFHCLSEWSGAQPDVVKLVEKSLNDPDSFEHEETLVAPVVGGEHRFTMSFRAKNAFGGLVLSKAKGVYASGDCSAVTLHSVE